MNEEAKSLHSPAPVPLTLVGVWMVHFRKVTGEITQVSMQSTASAGMLTSDEIGMCEIPGAGLGLGLLEALTYGARHYVDTSAFFPQIRARTACPAALEGLTLRCLPLPCQIEITAPLSATRTYDEADDSELDLSFDHPGVYTLRVLSARHTPGVFTLTV